MRAWMAAAVLGALMAGGCSGTGDQAAPVDTGPAAGPADTVARGADSTSDSTSDVSSDASPDGTNPALTIEIQTSPSVGLVAVVVATTDVPTMFTGTVRDAETGTTETIEPSGPSMVHEHLLTRLQADRAYEVHVAVTAGDRSAEQDTSFTTPRSPPELPGITLVASQPDRMQPGLTAIGLRNTKSGTRLTVFVDGSGQIVHYVLGWDAATVLDGGDLLGITDAYALCRTTILGVTVFCAKPGPLGTPVFHHQPSETADGTILALGLEARTVDGFQNDHGAVSYTLVGDVIYELEAPGTVVRSYSLLDRLDPHRIGPVFDVPYWDLAFPEYPGGTHDWSHANAAIHDPTDDSILVTVLGQSWVVKLDRQTGDVRWRLGEGGDFTLDKGDFCTLLHHAEPEADGHVLLYCNRPAGLPWESAAVDYALEMPSDDPATWRAVETWRHALQPTVATRILGEAHRLDNGNVLICDAAVEGEQPGSHSFLWGRVAEVDPADDTEVYRIDVTPAQSEPGGYVISGVARIPSISQ